MVNFFVSQSLKPSVGVYLVNKHSQGDSCWFITVQPIQSSPQNKHNFCLHWTWSQTLRPQKHRLYTIWHKN